MHNNEDHRDGDEVLTDELHAIQWREKWIYFEVIFLVMAGVILIVSIDLWGCVRTDSAM